MSRTYRGQYRHGEVYRLTIQRRRSRLIAAAVRLLRNLFPPEPPATRGGRASW